MARLGACNGDVWPNKKPGKNMLIARVKNMPIGRDVEVYYVDAVTVYTVGHPFNGEKPMTFYEPRGVFEEAIGLFPESVVWSHPLERAR